MPRYKKYFQAAHINTPIAERTERRHRNQPPEQPQQIQNENVKIIFSYLLLF